MTEIAKLLKRLKKHFPNDSHAINPNYNIYPGSEGIDILYFVHIGNKCENFKTFSEVKRYINEITETLTVNKLTKIWAKDGNSSILEVD